MTQISGGRSSVRQDGFIPEDAVERRTADAKLARRSQLVPVIDLEHILRWLRLSGPVFRVFKWKDCSVVVVSVGM
jgi:hypothetical protein